MSIKTRTSGIMVDINVEPAGGGPFHANAVSFDGTNNWLSRDAALSGVANGKVGIFSCWFKMTGGDGTNQSFLVSDPTNSVQIQRRGTNLLQFFFPPSNVYRSSATYTSGMSWAHMLAAWDLATTTFLLYVDGADVTSVISTLDQTITYGDETNWFVGAFNVVPQDILFADIAELYFNTATTLDISVQANREKFRSALGKPVSLGADGSTPTGSAPAIYLTNPTATWETNAGTGGGFTEHGTLTTAPTSPSD